MHSFVNNNFQYVQKDVLPVSGDSYLLDVCGHQHNGAIF